MGGVVAGKVEGGGSKREWGKGEGKEGSGKDEGGGDMGDAGRLRRLQAGVPEQTRGIILLSAPHHLGH